MADFVKIKEQAQSYSADMNAFLRAIVKNPGESCDEKAHINTIAAEMKKVGFDEVQIDPQGNVIGYMGQLEFRSLRRLRKRDGNRRSGRFRPVRRHCLFCLRGKDHERSKPDTGRLQDHGRGNGPGRGLRRALLAVHHPRR